MMISMKLLLAVLVFFVPQDDKTTFDQAKKDPSKRDAWLTKHLSGIKGQVQGWYRVDDKDSRQKALAALREEFKAQEMEFYFKKDSKKILAVLDSGKRRVLPFYFEAAIFGDRENSGVILLGKIFELENRDEALSILQDYVGETVRFREEGLTFGEEELDIYVPAMKKMSHTSLIEVQARSVQLENVLKGARTVSQGFRRSVISRYLEAYQKFSKDFAAQEKIWNDNNENSLQLEIVEFLRAYRKNLHKRILKVGHLHKLVDKAKHEYTLESTN